MPRPTNRSGTGPLALGNPGNPLELRSRKRGQTLKEKQDGHQVAPSRGLGVRPGSDAEAAPAGSPTKKLRRTPGKARLQRPRPPPGALSAKALAARVLPEHATAQMSAQKTAAGKAAAATVRQGRQRVPLRECMVDGERFCQGDCAYVITEGCDWEDSVEEAELCDVCGESARRGGARRRRAVPLLECDRCLRGFHLDCLRPPLLAVPEGDWLCADCAAGRVVAPPCNPVTARQRFLAGKLGLVRIEALWRDSTSGEVWYRGRWYCRPEETAQGRQAHHSARDVYLSETADANEAASLLRAVTVCAPGELAEHEGDDVFVCDHLYHRGCQVFRALDDVEEGAGEAGCARRGAASEDDDVSDDSVDAAFDPKRSPRPAVHGSRRRCLQGGEDWAAGQREQILGLGAAGIPASLRVREGTRLERARAALALTAVPASLPCREKERADISQFAEDAITGKDGQGPCLYVVGVPGTGKTATVREVMRGLRARADAGKLPGFRFVEVNALRLPSPQHVYVQLYQALTGRHASPASAMQHLEQLYTNSAGPGPIIGAKPGSSAGAKQVTVLLVDEMDLLITKKQQVLYNLCEWPAREGSRLAVIGIANTLDLPERLLPKIASRLGSRRVEFKPYKRDQLEAIIAQRLADAGVQCAFEAKAVRYAAGKVAVAYGDVRRALELCRKAAEVAEEQALLPPTAGIGGSAGAATASEAAATRDPDAPSPPPQPGQVGVVQMSHVDVAVQEMFRSPHMQLLGNCCRLEKVLLAGLVIETRATGRSDAVLSGVWERMRSLCEPRSEEAPLRVGDAVSAAARLGAKRLCLAEPAAARLRMRLSLNVHLDDVVHMLKTDATIGWLSQLNL